MPETAQITWSGEPTLLVLDGNLMLECCCTTCKDCTINGNPYFATGLGGVVSDGSPPVGNACDASCGGYSANYNNFGFEFAGYWNSVTGYSWGMTSFNCRSICGDTTASGSKAMAVYLPLLGYEHEMGVVGVGLMGGFDYAIYIKCVSAYEVEHNPAATTFWVWGNCMSGQTQYVTNYCSSLLSYVDEWPTYTAGGLSCFLDYFDYSSVIVNRTISEDSSVCSVLTYNYDNPIVAVLDCGGDKQEYCVYKFNSIWGCPEGMWTNAGQEKTCEAVPDVTLNTWIQDPDNPDDCHKSYYTQGKKCEMNTECRPAPFPALPTVDVEDYCCTKCTLLWKSTFECVDNSWGDWSMQKAECKLKADFSQGGEYSDSTNHCIKYYRQNTDDLCDASGDCTSITPPEKPSGTPSGCCEGWYVYLYDSYPCSLDCTGYRGRSQSFFEAYVSDPAVFFACQSSGLSSSKYIMLDGPYNTQEELHAAHDYRCANVRLTGSIYNGTGCSSFREPYGPIDMNMNGCYVDLLPSLNSGGCVNYIGSCPPTQTVTWSYSYIGDC